MFLAVQRDTSDEVRKCGCSSVVERHVANVNVVSSNLITRFVKCVEIVSASYRLSDSLALVTDAFKGSGEFELADDRKIWLREK